jgi:hypothetical protein
VIVAGGHLTHGLRCVALTGAPLLLHFITDWLKPSAMQLPARDIIRIVVTLFWPLLYGGIAIAVVTLLFALLGRSG